MGRFPYGVLRREASKLIRDAGQPAIIRKLGSYDGWTGEETGGEDVPCRVVVSEYSLRERESSLISQGDKKVLVSALPSGKTVGLADRLVIGDELSDPQARGHEISNVSEINPGGTSIAWELQVVF
ncbi:hypothetical protein DYI37_03135 [Fulvimarina endophytica]|uniref:Uncharacterized protein n=1 Tax=Fulvimarina endophytica TaxID=2293836 RepID=A0A371XB80_9HYPH|nr:hypothetical protein [Fulvimarina endophytica]RFC66452.1 hypothetical protein DYI37_03135 [Fulvimarina endophytica]